MGFRQRRGGATDPQRRQRPRRHRGRGAGVHRPTDGNPLRARRTLVHAGAVRHRRRAGVRPSVEAGATRHLPGRHRRLERWSKANQGKAFAELEPSAQDDILQRLEAGQIDLQDLPAKLLFGQLLQNTHEGFFSDPQHGGNRGLVGWKLVGFPGARADFMDWADRGEVSFPPVAISGERG